MTEQWNQRSSNDYVQGFNNLLPTGPAWPRSQDTVLQNVIKGLADLWGDPVETSAANLLTIESDPRTTTALLPDWERAFGLPDKCLAEPLTVGDRRTALVVRMTMLGAQSRAFFIGLAAAIGYTITISEFRPFMVGIDRVGDNRTLVDGVYSDYPYVLGPPDNRFYWQVHVGRTRLTWFRASSGQAGVDHHLRIALATDLECMLRRYKPSHTEIIFDYSGLETGGAMAGTP